MIISLCVHKTIAAAEQKTMHRPRMAGLWNTVSLILATYILQKFHVTMHYALSVKYMKLRRIIFAETLRNRLGEFSFIRVVHRPKWSTILFEILMLFDWCRCSLLFLLWTRSIWQINGSYVHGGVVGNVRSVEDEKTIY